MARLKQVFVAAFALLLASGALARPLTEAESGSLVATVEAFNAAMRAKDYEAIVKTIPPRVLAHIAKSVGAEVEALRKIVIEEMKKTLVAVKIESFGMDLSKAEHRELPGGEPYVLVPTQTVMDPGEGGKMKAKSHTLALLDGGVWYLLRVNDPQQVAIMRQVYPEFVGVEFPSGSLEALQ
jgi:hypothetical protein